LKQNDFQRAETLMEKAEEHCGESDKVRQNSAVLFALLGEYDQAIEHINKSIKKEVQNPELYYNRAIVYLYQGAYLPAIDDFKIATGFGGKKGSKSERHAVGLKRQSEAKQIEAYIKLAEQATADQNLELAHQYYDQGLLLKPDDAHLLFAKSVLGLLEGEPFVSLEIAEKINHVGTTPQKQLELTLLKAYCMGRINRMPEAIRLLENEIHQESGDEDIRARELLAYYYLKLSKYQKTLEVLRGRHVTHANTYVVWGNAAIRLKKYTFALACFDRAKSMQQGNIHAEVGSAICYSFLNKHDKSISLIDSLSIVHADNHSIWNVKGIIHKDIGLYHKNNGHEHRAKPYFETSAAAFLSAKVLNHRMKKVYDSNRALSLFLQNQKEAAKVIWTGNDEMSSQNNLAIYYASQREFNQAYQLLVRLSDDLWDRQKKKHQILDYNKNLVRSRTPLNNNYKFLTNYKLNQDLPTLELENPFQLETDSEFSETETFDYMLAYSDKDCKEKTKRKKSKKKKRFKLFKRKKKKYKGDCPTF